MEEARNNTGKSGNAFYTNYKAEKMKYLLVLLFAFILASCSSRSETKVEKAIRESQEDLSHATIIQTDEIQFINSKEKLDQAIKDFLESEEEVPVKHPNSIFNYELRKCFPKNLFFGDVVY